jgi:hypothetical protein
MYSAYCAKKSLRYLGRGVPIVQKNRYDISDVHTRVTIPRIKADSYSFRWHFLRCEIKRAVIFQKSATVQI